MVLVRQHLAYTFEPIRVETWRPDALEEEIEAGLARRLMGTFRRQVECCGLRPDIVITWANPITVDALTIVEVKREVIGHRALAQLLVYLDHWTAHHVDEPGRMALYGILAAPAIRPSVREDVHRAGIAFAPLELVRRAA